MKSYIHFIRHGITQGILNKWYYGNVDLPLIDEGVRELRDLKAQGIYPDAGGAACYTSGMLRANQTFEVIYESSNYRVISDLREISFGDWECKTFEELKAQEGFDEWMNDRKGEFTFPGGDSPLGFYNRVSRGLDELLAAHRNTGAASSIVVCHGGVISACMCRLLNEPKENFWEWTPGPGRGYSVALDGKRVLGYQKL